MSWATDLSPTTIFSSAAQAGHATDVQHGGAGGVPGVRAWVGTGEGIPGTYPAGQIEAYLRNYRIYWFIRPFD